MFTEIATFVKESIREFESTGSLCPTSSRAALALTAPLREERPMRRILEVGPGTGAVTVKILENMNEADRLTICEINPRFMQALKERLADNEHFLAHKARIDFFEGPIQDLPEKAEPYDLIFCAIPFLNLDRRTIEDIFAKLRKISSEQTLMTYYEYIGLRALSKVVSPSRRKKRMHEIEQFFQNFNGAYRGKPTRIWWNFLPINIYTLRVAGT